MLRSTDQWYGSSVSHHHWCYADHSSPTTLQAAVSLREHDGGIKGNVITADINCKCLNFVQPHQLLKMYFVTSVDILYNCIIITVYWAFTPSCTRYCKIAAELLTSFHWTQYEYMLCKFYLIYFQILCHLPMSRLFSPPTILAVEAGQSLAVGQKPCQSCLCVIPTSLRLCCSTCCHLRKLRRDYCSWPTPTWNHWSSRWTSCTAEYTLFTLFSFAFLWFFAIFCFLLFSPSFWTLWRKKRICNERYNNKNLIIIRRMNLFWNRFYVLRKNSKCICWLVITGMLLGKVT